MKLKNLLTSFVRRINNLRRPSRQINLKKLQERGENPDNFIFRDATEKDIHELGKLHAITWAETYNAQNPNIKLRQSQWDKSFTEQNDGSWFCQVIETNNNELVGFAKGVVYKKQNDSVLHGELNKIYLLKDYQRLGLGSKLFHNVAARFIKMGINDMILFGIPQNPSSYFHEAMGGKKIYSDKGIFDGGYKWDDLYSLPNKSLKIPD